MALLACNTDVNMQGFVVDDSRHALPLEVAIDLGEDVLVGELLQRGSTVTSELLATAVCMPWCSTGVLVKLMQTGEFVEWAREIGDEKLYRSVFNSARPNAGDSRKTDKDHVALAQRLRQIGQDLSADSPFGAELIERAVHAAHTSLLEFLLPPDQPPPSRFLLAASTGDTSETVSVVRFLLSKGVDVQAVSHGGGDTALHLAARCPWEPRSFELTQMLIDAGCNPHMRNLRGEIPLTITAKRGYRTVLELLLSCNVPLPPDILPIALKQKIPPQIIQSLIPKGADVHSTSDGDTALHLAVAGYIESTCLDLFNSLIEAGCNPAACNSRGKTVLEVAILRGYNPVVELLLSCNIPPPRDILPIALKQRIPPQIIQSLIPKGVDVHSTSDGDTALHLAIAGYIESTCLDLFNSLIEAGCSPAACNSQGKTVLEVAILHGYNSVVELLLSCNIPPPRDILQITLRQRSISQIIQSLILKGADVHFTTSDGDTLLHLAIAVNERVESRRLNLMKTFIEAGCNPAACNSQGKTALEVAILRGYTSVVELLLSCNVPFPPDILQIALRQRSTLEMVQFLIRQGANVHLTASNGDTALHLAVAGYIESTCLDLFNSLIEAGCSPAACNSQGKTVLEVAILHGYNSVVELLLSCNVPFPPDILQIALRQRSTLEIVQFLIRKGANVHLTTSDGDTILHLAIAEDIESRCLNLMKTFIEAGCNPATCNSEGKTVLEVAIEHEYTSVVELLLSYNVPFPPDILQTALRRRSTLEMAQFLICKGADVHATTSNGDTALYFAIAGYIEFTCLDLINSLIEAGCNPATDPKGKTVLEVAVERRYTSVVELLLSYNVPFHPDILQIALRRRLPLRMVQSLICKGADVHSTTSNGDTVLHLAIAEYVESTCLDLVSGFIKAGCNPVSCNSEGQTALEAATLRGYTLVVELLLSYNVPFPLDILQIALRRRCTPLMIQSLMCKGANVHWMMVGSNWDTLLQLVRASYFGQDCQEIITILDGARDSEARRMHPARMDGIPIHVARPRRG